MTHANATNIAFQEQLLLAIQKESLKHATFGNRTGELKLFAQRDRNEQ